MSKNIKTREVVRDIKILDKSAVPAERMKETFIRTRDEARQAASPAESRDAEYDSPTVYAEDKVTGAAENTVRHTAAFVQRQGKKLHKKIKEQREANRAEYSRHGESASAQAESAAENYGVPTHDNSSHVSNRPMRQSSLSTNTPELTSGGGPADIRRRIPAEKTIKHSARSADRTIKTGVKGTVKTANKSIKTAEQTSKTVIKTTQQAAKAAQKSAQTAAKAAKHSAQVTQAAKKTAEKTVKAVAKVIKSMIKAAIAATKALIIAICAGGGAVLAAVIAVAAVALLLYSVFGIFFSSEKFYDDLPVMKTVINEINEEYYDELDRIIAENPHDVLEMSGSRAVWREVLAVYSVKVNTDAENGQEVATLDGDKQQLLREVFWDMHIIAYSTAIVAIQETVITTDENGEQVEELQTFEKAVLYISVSHKSVDEMAAAYSFNSTQAALLSELLDPYYNDMWRSALYGIRNGDTDIVAVALSQVGNVGGEPYWSWYGWTERVAWCACFVSWCANECGYIESGIIPMFAYCPFGEAWFKERGQWEDSSYEPAPGDIIFFDWESDGENDHVGIVNYVENGIVYTIEGNTSDSCLERSYTLGGTVIYGYGVPAY